MRTPTGKLKRRVGTAVAALALSVGGMLLPASPAMAHGCSHSDHYTYYNGHNHYTSFINHHYHGSQHWHTWYDVHGYYESYCFG